MKRWHLAVLVGALVACGSTSFVICADESGYDGAAVGDAAQDGPASKPMRTSGETFSFQAEVNRLMDIIIHSLYSNKDIFLRELISNASDALDKIRLLSLSDSKQLGEGSAANLEIRMEIDGVNNVLKLRDRGVGMTKDDLIKNLGTIAKSGTSSFLEKMQQSGDANLIGQFGVGFYSVYLVSDYVEVITKHNDDTQYIWESKAGGEFVITEDTGGQVSGEGDLERGTLIRIHLKEENMEYAQETRIKELVGKYSEFINFPIYLLTSKEVEVEDDEAAEARSSDDEADDDSEEPVDGFEDEPDEAAGGSATKRTEIVLDWELLNSNKALWLRTPKDVEEEEYTKFFQALSKDAEAEPAAHAHFKAEGDVEFRSILFLPSKAPWDFYDTYYSRKPAVKLYVRRVFISDDFEDLLPRYLSFLLGLVDSDTLPLNVSREMLQQHSSLKTIKKKLVRKALEMIKRLAENEAKGRKALQNDAEGDESGDGADGEAPVDKDALRTDVAKYETFWEEFGRALKLGVVEDSNNRGRLAKLLRFYTSKSKDTLANLDEYVARMKEGQKSIYYICGTSMAEVEQSPYLEQLLEKGYEVIMFTEPMDEYMMQNLVDYEDMRFHNAAKEDLKLSDDDDVKKLEKQLRKEFKPLTKWWRSKVGQEGNLEAVRVSNRLSSTPCVVVTSKYGWSANMQRIMSAQALANTERHAFMQGKRALEINPRHPLIVGLLDKVQEDPEDAGAIDTARLLFETALLESGYPMQDNKGFATRVYELMREQIGVQRELGDLHPEPKLKVEEVEDDATDAADEEDDANFDLPHFNMGDIRIGDDDVSDEL